LYRRPHALVASWSADGLKVENYLTGRLATVSPLVLQLLDGLDEPHSHDEITARFGALSDRGTLVDALIASDLLLEVDSVADRRDAQLERTWRWPHAARYFHFTTREVDYSFDFEKQRRFFEEKALRDPPPSCFKEPRAGDRGVQLAPFSADDPFFALLDRRRTCRSFAQRALSFTALSQLVTATWGVQRYYNASVLDRRVIKRSPSGGARHPIEAYVVAVDIEGVVPAVYHYDARDDTLRYVAALPDRDERIALFGGQWWVKDAPALFFMTAALPRSMWKYDFARAYRVVLLDAGHVGQTFHLAGTALGLGVFTTAALADPRIERLLAIDGISETILYAAAAGFAGSHDNTETD
jgi:SagB-type dehydrogenase family enzyme